MKRQSNTYILLFLFLALAGAFGYQKITEKIRAREILFEKKIVNFNDTGSINIIEVSKNGETIFFAKIVKYGRSANIQSSRFIFRNSLKIYKKPPFYLLPQKI